MKTVKALTVITAVLLVSCSPQNVRLSDEMKNSRIEAFLYIRDVPEPFTTIYNWGAFHMGQRSLIPSGKEEAEMKELLKQSGLRSMLVEEVKKGAPLFEKAAAVGIVDHAFQNISLPEKRGMNDKSNTIDDYSSFIKHGRPYLFVISVDSWGYYYNSRSDTCYYEVDLTGELIHMASGTVVWRKAPRALEAVRMMPVVCGHEPAQADRALRGTIRTQIRIMADDILGGR
ncbi:MAG TPA: hypothetical protein PK926_06025 [Spirochaetota bacterium]|mgnify:CR=1 FL=1|nr:hypothetical protein [Spirochaetota bacterium]HPI87679.1 hypothetical protein [Spirochaetota bacterium]HPR49709.1 hypothetical protein [Spirochaetota bacterium]